MSDGSRIVSISAREIYGTRGHPAVQTTVTTANGARGVADVTAGISIGKYEVKFAYDGGQRFRGMGVNVAAERIEQVIAPKLIGMDAANQQAVDQVIIEMDGTPDKSNLGGNVTASVSAATLKAGAASLGIPLYQHIGGTNARLMPVPGEICLVGSNRYGGVGTSGGKPSYSFMFHGFNSFSEASYAAWDLAGAYAKTVSQKFGLDFTLGRVAMPAGFVSHERELWDVMVESIIAKGYEGRVGIQVDVAAGTYWVPDRERYVGIFSAEDKTRDDLLRLYETMVENYPFVIIEDPLDEDDYEGHAMVTKALGIEIVGDDLFTTNTERVQHGIETGAANCVLLKVNQIGTISEAIDMVQLAYRHGYGVMPCNSRGEGPSIADYTVGLGTGHLREGAIGDVGNRFLEIEAELGSRAQFIGLKGLKGSKNQGA